ncbi:MAG: hypothetical protein RSF68_00120 [Myroides sp.]
MKFKLLTITIFSVALFSCGNSEGTKINYESEPSNKTLTTDTKLEDLKTEASRLRAGGSVKTVELIGEKATITYVANYKEYKKLNPQSSLTEEQLQGYWETGDAIHKALIDGSVRIMRKLDFVNEVNIILPYQNNVYEISVNKPELEKFIGSDFETIINNWEKTFYDPYVYSKEGRKAFFEKFGTEK